MSKFFFLLPISIKRAAIKQNQGLLFFHINISGCPGSFTVPRHPPFKHLRISLVERSLPRRGPYRNRHRLPPHHRHGRLRSGASGAGGRRHFHRRLRQAFCRPFRPDRLRAEKQRYFEENREVWRAPEDAHLAKSEDHRRFQLPPRQPAEPPCRLPCKKPAPPHHQHRPAASGFLPEPRDLSGNLLPIAHSEALKNPAIQKMAEKYGVPRPALHPLRFGAGRGCPPQTANPAHMADNAKVDFSISSEGTEVLKAMKHIETYGDFDVFPVFSSNPLS